ncbi:hypothetical protein AB0E69_01490 [Kribbella sp. NPDC026611]|uniref:hypothetical protein n=1 Tax=Kribbella sp. NPDC026611 TaxID=3154911 RepID=UPI0033CC0A12
MAESTPTSSTTSAPAPASSVPPAGPLGSAAYQAELARIDQVLAKPAQALTRVRTAEGLTEAMGTLATTMNTVATRLADLQVTSRLTAVHQLLQERLGVAATTLGKSDEAEENARCGGAAYTSQKIQRQLLADLAGALEPMERLKLKFGSTLPDPGPAPKLETPSSGEILVRKGPEGTGRLKLTNGTAKDVAVSIVTEGKPPGQPQLLVYLQATKSTMIDRIGGAYQIYFKSGSEWNPDRKQFSANCAFQKFDQTFGKNQGWQVNLQPTPGGNAKTTEVEAY